MEFEWDPAKATANLRKHNLAFTEAATVFADPLSSTVSDPDHSLDEQRWITIGCSNRGRFLLVSHADRGATVRIVSARPLTAAERKAYEETNR